MNVTGPDFLAPQVRLDAASPRPGAGILPWLCCDDTQALHGEA
ncbi:hypothetical protein [Amycolatopsis sp. NBC_01480]|nr:hypothetical protein [Amycolatopsis sp. NBC_01480]